MAIAHSHIVMLMQLRKAGLVGGGKTDSLMEIGEQNWWGDVPPREIHHVIDAFEKGEQAAASHQELDLLLAADPVDVFALAKASSAWCSSPRSIAPSGYTARR